VSEGTLAHLVERLAERVPLKVEWTDAAKRAAGERGTALNLQDLTVADVLIDLILPLADPVGLVATVKGGTLRLARSDLGRWAAESRLRLAEIALLDDRPQEALQACRKLLEDKQPVKRETVLPLMGQAYEKAGEYRQAARCFAGQLPE
jgi:hypothetical protein